METAHPSPNARAPLDPGRVERSPDWGSSAPAKGARGIPLWERPLPVRLAGLSIPLLLGSICILSGVDSGTVYESPRLLLALNLVFGSLVSLVVAYLVARAFLEQGRLGLLLFGCGVLIWGTAGLMATLAGWLRPVAGFDLDALSIVHNTCVWLAALCHLGGVILARRLAFSLSARALWLVAGYGLALGAAGAVFWLALIGWLPVFLMPGGGSTPARQFVLGSGISLFVLTALLLGESGERRSDFGYWYALALLALAVGLFGIMIQTMPGTLVGWAGRIGQYFAGTYMLVAALIVLRQPDGDRALSRSLGDARSAGPDQSPVGTHYPYIVAVALILSAAALRHTFLANLGIEASYLVFYPAVVLAALYGGLGSGLMASVLSIVVSDWFWVEPVGSLGIAHSSDLLEMTVFLVGGALIAWTAEAMHRAQARAVAAETEAGFAAERARAAQAVQQSLDRLALGIQVSGIALADLDYGSGAVRLSAEAARLFGFGDRAMVVSRARLHERFHPDDRGELMRRIEASLDPAGPGCFAMDHRVVWPDGRVRWLSATKRVAFDRSGPAPVPATAILAAQDITERRQAQEALARQAEQLQEADRRKDEFLAMLGHELRNPLTPILVAAQVLETRGDDDPELVRWAGETVRRQGEQLTRLVDELLDASRVTQGKIALSLAPVDLGVLLARVAETVGPTMEERGHRLVLDGAGQSLTIEGDEMRLQQVLVNLLCNAAKYTPNGGRIRLGLARDGAQVLIRVRDNGIGIAPAMLPKVFGLFVQAEGSRERSQGGLGIGLALAKSLVEMHGGTLEAASPGIGLGTEMTLRFPLAEDVEAVDPQLAGPWAPARESRQVLVVDDRDDVRGSLQVLLESLGHRVRVAAGGQEALDLARERIPDAMLIDIGMPGIDGYEVARRIRRDPDLRGIRLIAMTGYGQLDDRAGSERAGFDRHLVKPVDPRLLAELLIAEDDPVPGDCSDAGPTRRRGADPTA